MPTRRDTLLMALASPRLAAAAAVDGGLASPALQVAQILSAHDPVNAPLGYVSALIWQAQRRLSPTGALPARSQQALLALRQVASGTAVPADWPQRAGYAAFADAATAEGDAASRELARQAVAAVITDTPEGPRLTGLRRWTDDMFMATLLLDRAGPLLPAADRQRAAEALGAALLAHAETLQRPDGLFHHADGSPVAWGRGNGFAALALAQALAGLLPPQASPVAAQLLQRLQAHLHALLARQGADGAWRQVLDQPAAPAELTVTAMALNALTLARSRGWLPAGLADAAIAPAWTAVQSRVDAAAGLFTDVCASTPAGPTLAFYLQRPILRGRDDRAAAMVLQAAVRLAMPPG